MVSLSPYEDPLRQNNQKLLCVLLATASAMLDFYGGDPKVAFVIHIIRISSFNCLSVYHFLIRFLLSIIITVIFAFAIISISVVRN